ncbi:Uncharacterized alpha/beta hydrolase domain [Geodermatophilus obscurus]|uniref:Uncharacterized alpha/beta hydrolase domain n=1 Tax=Geodermatophilus obscurus TaxID=1861 RepID=A0A1I5FJF7_9ACTN|nr:DUF2235 domain-containing protein [Geodermatophilus obscurus]SFO23864.1 Uncharacterized alpha/beta hydrolase domain [Geodermatophilus obscurus]
MPKRLVLCCDGTWNTAGRERDGRLCPTNVAKVALGVDGVDGNGVEQRVYYQQGVGTRPGERLRGGAFGMGLSRNVQDAYRFLVENYEPGDELFAFGFSRGAYTARSTVGLVRTCGVLRREHAGRLKEAYARYRSRTEGPRDLESQLFRRSYSHEPRVRFLGVWDTVGSLGVPSVGLGLSRLVNRRFEFHDTRLSSTVDAAYQALAIDERRRPFAPTLWDRRSVAGRPQVEQVWFSGDHCDVGGGHARSELADITLLWMVDRARSCGLAFREDAYRRPADGAPRTFDGRTFPVEPDPLGVLHDSRRWFFRLVRPYARPIGVEDPDSESVASSAVRRHGEPRARYAPRQLVAYLEGRPRVTDVPLGNGARTGMRPLAGQVEPAEEERTVAHLTPPGPGSPEIDL